MTEVVRPLIKRRNQHGVAVVLGSYGPNRVGQVEWVSSLEECMGIYELSPFGVSHVEFASFFGNGGMQLMVMNVGECGRWNDPTEGDVEWIRGALVGVGVCDFLVCSETLGGVAMKSLMGCLLETVDRQQGMVLASPSAGIGVNEVDEWMLEWGLHAKHVAVYFPRIRHREWGCEGSVIFAVAGLFSRFDHEVGPWRAPSGTSAVLEGHWVPVDTLSNEETIGLNRIGCNVVRQFKMGTLLWGGVTGVGLQHEQAYWRYISIRRSLLMIRRHVESLRGWLVENVGRDERVGEWVTEAIRVFLVGLYDAGALVGKTVDEGYTLEFMSIDGAMVWQYGVCLMTEGEYMMSSLRV